MLFFAFKTILIALFISFLSWLSGRSTHLAGFLTALPITTIIALAFSHVEWNNEEQSVAYAKSIFFALPLTLLFFVPFFLAQKLNLNFWACYSTGIVLLGLGYLLNSFITKI